jgi:hypothetical protein
MGELQLYVITNLALGEWPSVITDARSRPCSMASARRAHLMEENSPPGRMVALAGNVRF